MLKQMCSWDHQRSIEVCRKVRNDADLFANEIQKCSLYTKEYTDDFHGAVPKTGIADIWVRDVNTVQAIKQFNGNGKCAALNFASYKYPGGGFINGSMAQEESLCHASFLYNVLKNFDSSYYEWNRNHLNKSLYTNHALYSPDVIFTQYGSNFKCDVITCAAPNRRAALNIGVSEQSVLSALEDRVHFILEIARDNKVDTLILGAYGCGVFGNNASIVARLFREYLLSEFLCFKTVIFAIPYGPNFIAFNKEFNKNLGG